MTVAATAATGRWRARTPPRSARAWPSSAVTRSTSCASTARSTPDPRLQARRAAHMSEDGQDAHHQNRLPGPRRGRGRDVREGRRRDGRRRQAPHLRAAALLRGAAARPLVHGGARHHRPHLRHLPDRLPDERGAGDGGRLRRGDRLRARCATCGASSTAASGSRATACTSTCCTRPTSSATRARSRWPATTRDIVGQGLEMKKAGNALIAMVGGREVHPINIRVGGFYRAPDEGGDALGARAAAACPRDGARDRRGGPPRWTSRTSRCEPELVALSRARRATRSTSAGSSPTAGWTSRPPSSTRTSSRSTSSTPTRCTPASATRGSYLTGPLARWALSGGELRPLAAAGRERRRACERDCRNPFRSIIVRAVELVQACDEAIAIIERLRGARRARRCR